MISHKKIFWLGSLVAIFFLASCGGGGGGGGGGPKGSKFKLLEVKAVQGDLQEGGEAQCITNVDCPTCRCFADGVEASLLRYDEIVVPDKQPIGPDIDLHAVVKGAGQAKKVPVITVPTGLCVPGPLGCEVTFTVKDSAGRVSNELKVGVLKKLGGGGGGAVSHCLNTIAAQMCPKGQKCDCPDNKPNCGFDEKVCKTETVTTPECTADKANDPKCTDPARPFCVANKCSPAPPPPPECAKKADCKEPNLTCDEATHKCVGEPVWKPENGFIGDDRVFVFGVEKIGAGGWGNLQTIGGLFQITRTKGNWETVDWIKSKIKNYLNFSGVETEPLYNPTNGKIELWLLEESLGHINWNLFRWVYDNPELHGRLIHVRGKDAEWEKAEPDVISKAGVVVSSSPVSLFHSSGDVYLATADDGGTLHVYQWKFNNTGTGETTVNQEKTIEIPVDQALPKIKAGSALAMVENPATHDVEIFALDATQKILLNYSVASQTGVLSSKKIGTGTMFIGILSAVTDGSERIDVFGIASENWGTLVNWYYKAPDGWGNDGHEKVVLGNGLGFGYDLSTFAAIPNPSVKDQAEIFMSAGGLITHPIFPGTPRYFLRKISLKQDGTSTDVEIGSMVASDPVSVIFNPTENRFEVYGRLDCPTNPQLNPCDQPLIYYSLSQNPTSVPIGPHISGLGLSSSPQAVFNGYKK